MSWTVYISFAAAYQAHYLLGSNISNYGLVIAYQLVWLLYTLYITYCI